MSWEVWRRDWRCEMSLTSKWCISYLTSHVSHLSGTSHISVSDASHFSRLMFQWYISYLTSHVSKWYISYLTSHKWYISFLTSHVSVFVCVSVLHLISHVSWVIHLISHVSCFTYLTSHVSHLDARCETWHVRHEMYHSLTWDVSRSLTWEVSRSLTWDVRYETYHSLYPAKIGHVTEAWSWYL